MKIDINQYVMGLQREDLEDQACLRIAQNNLLPLPADGVENRLGRNQLMRNEGKQSRTVRSDGLHSLAVQMEM